MKILVTGNARFVGFHTAKRLHIFEGIVLATDDIAEPNMEWNSNQPDPAKSNAPFRIFNIGNNSPVRPSEYIEALETAPGRKATQELLPLQTGDVPDTYADASDMVSSLGFTPAATPLRQGVENFVRWYRARYENESD